MLKSTKKHSDYWIKRKIDWNQAYLSTWNHPHRALISRMVRSMGVGSLWEVGCGPGANIVRIIKDNPDLAIQVGGSDVSKDAVEVASKVIQGGLFHVENGDDMLLSDKATDLIFSDMCLIYVGPFKIRRYLREMKRIGRKYILLCEFHSPSWWKRQLARIDGYHVYDYRKLLESEGFYDVRAQRIPVDMWPGTDNNTEFRYIITAKI